MTFFASIFSIIQVEMKFEVNDYVAEKYIGKGSTSKVYQGKNVKTGQLVAIKKMDLEAVKNCRYFFEREINIMKNIDNPHIIKLYDYIEDLEKKKAYLILEFCQYGDLSRFLKNRALKEKHAKNFMHQLADALRFLLGKNIMHRDLKPQNILICENRKIKITDFGLSRYFDNQNMIDTICGSPLYMSPEIMKNNKYDSKSDLWSVGVILYEMIVGELPFYATNHYQLVKKIHTAPVIIPDNAKMSNECRDLISKLLDKNPETRIGWIDFFDHPWMSNRIERMINKVKNIDLEEHLHQIELDDQQFTTSVPALMQQGDHKEVEQSAFAKMKVSELLNFDIEDEEEKKEVDQKQGEIENEYLNEYIEEDFNKVLDGFDHQSIQLTGYMDKTLYKTASEPIAIPKKPVVKNDLYVSPEQDGITIDGLTPSSKYLEKYGTSPMFNEDPDTFVMVQNVPSREVYENSVNGNKRDSIKKRIQNYLNYSVYVFRNGF